MNRHRGFYAYSLLSCELHFPVGYHWKCVCDHYTCAESRDLWGMGQKKYIFEIIDLYLPVPCATLERLQCQNPYQCKFPMREIVTLTFDMSTSNSYHTWRLTSSILPPSLKILDLVLHALWVLMFSISYHWKSLRGHYACAQSRDPWVGGQKQLHFLGISDSYILLNIKLL